jgi:hypothetical protein
MPLQPARRYRPPRSTPGLRQSPPCPIVNMRSPRGLSEVSLSRKITDSLASPSAEPSRDPTDRTGCDDCAACVFPDLLRDVVGV